MCAVIVGDFTSIDDVLQMLVAEFSSERPLPPGDVGEAMLATPPVVDVPAHNDPRSERSPSRLELFNSCHLPISASSRPHLN